MKRKPNYLSILPFLFLLTACQNQPTPNAFRRSTHTTLQTRANLQAKQVDALFLEARSQPSTHQEKTYLALTDNLLTETQKPLAKAVLETLDPIDADTVRHKKFNLAYVAILGKDHQDAKRRLESLSKSLHDEDRPAFYTMLSIYHLQKQQFRHYFKAANQAYDAALKQHDTALADHILTVMWQSLQTATSQQIKDIHAYRIDDVTDGWLSLKRIIDLEHGTALQDPHKTLSNLQNWQQTHKNHPGTKLLHFSPKKSRTSHLTPNHIGVLLPHSKNTAAISEAIETGIRLGYHHGHAPGQTLGFYDSSAAGVVHAYQEASKAQVDAIIGPLLKEDLQALASPRFPIPTLALNYDEHLTSPSLTQYSLSPHLELEQLALAMHIQGFRSTLVISDTSSKSSQLSKTFTEFFQEHGGNIADSVVLDPTTSNISLDIAKTLGIRSSEARARSISRHIGEAAKFIPQRRRDFDSIYVASSGKNARQIVPILRYHFSGKTPIFSSSSVYDGHDDPDHNKDLNGVRFLDTPLITPFQKTQGAFSANLLEQIRAGYPDTYQERFRFYALGLDAYLITQTAYLWEVMPSYLIPGSSGHISKNQHAIIQRQLSQLRFNQGRVKEDRSHLSLLTDWQHILQTAVHTRTPSLPQ